MNDLLRYDEELEEWWVTCPECECEQLNAGRGVHCEACGWGPLPVPEDSPAPQLPGW